MYCEYVVVFRRIPCLHHNTTLFTCLFSPHIYLDRFIMGWVCQLPHVCSKDAQHLKVDIHEWQQRHPSTSLSLTPMMHNHHQGEPVDGRWPRMIPKDTSGNQDSAENPYLPFSQKLAPNPKLMYAPVYER
jgi:hypothetical protein